MTFFIWFIPLFTCAVIWIDYRYIAKRLFAPIQILSLWWLFWLWIANFSFFNVYIPSVKTQELLLLFVVGLPIGELISRAYFKNINLKRDQTEYFLEKACRVSFIIAYPIVSFYFVKSIYLMHLVPLNEYRTLAFSTMENPGLIFDSQTVESLYFLITSPLLFFGFLFGIAHLIKYKNIQPLFLALILNFMDGWMRLARINIYSLLIMLFFMIMLSSFSRNEKKIHLSKNGLYKHRYKILALFAIVLVILQIGKIRNVSISKQIEINVVDYHTVGFALFDSELKDSHSPLNSQLTYGRLSIGGLETLMTIVIRRFDRHYMSPALGNAIRMTNAMVVGDEIKPPYQYPDHHKRYNSFYTMLYTFYSDGRVLGLLIAGVIIGGMCYYYYSVWLLTNSVYYFLLLMLVFSTTVLSLFVSQFETMRSWIVLIFLLSVKPILHVYHHFKNKFTKSDNSKTKPFVQIVLMSYNRPEFVTQAVESILNQDYPHFELLVSENSDSNQIMFLLAKYATNPRFRVLHRQPSLKSLDHFNQIINETSAELTMIFHDDDILLPDALSVLVKEINSDPNLVAVAGNAYLIYQNHISRNLINTELKNSKRIVKTVEELAEHYLVTERGIMPFPSYLYRTAAIKGLSLNSHDGGKHSDVSFLLSLIKRGPMLWTYEPVMNYRRHESNDSKLIDISSIRRICRYIQKNSRTSTGLILGYKLKHYYLWAKENSKVSTFRGKVFRKALAYYLIFRPIYLYKILIRKIQNLF